MEWKPVLFAGECESCEECGEPVCSKCGVHYVDCACPGPTQDGWEYQEIEGVLHAREIVN